MVVGFSLCIHDVNVALCPSCSCILVTSPIRPHGNFRLTGLDLIFLSFEDF